ncbi:DUF6544 family protein [Methanococcus maripaludis]|uniref:Uncharacterized protein n=1 Tax=Methanococcus maripaludis TaxID=39152 RepID=A0A8T4H428_METMI|nr:DUF6544 family protein [Methanococcus maripaludis]MBM7408381.1 hypothetical protein [Methanococcus maripaludis]MBP2220051.1 hypothetical protein [Methanococcus maripaludis]
MHILVKIFILLAFVTILMSLMVVTKSKNNTENLWAILDKNASEDIYFDENSLNENISPFAKKFINNSIKNGTKIPKTAILDIEGKMKTKIDETAPWNDISSKEILSKDGFVWKAKLKSGPLVLKGADYYFENNSEINFALYGLIPVVKESNKDITKSAIGRLAIELMVWNPWAVFNDKNTEFKDVDSETFSVSFEIDGEPVTVYLKIDENGSLKEVYMNRWNKLENGSYGYIPFGGTVSDHLENNGLKIAKTLNVGWNYGTEVYVETFYFNVTAAEFY